MAELAEQLGGVLIGDPDVEITGVAGIREARAGDLTFLADRRYAAAARSTQASAVLVATDHQELSQPLIQIADPYAAFLAAAQVFRPPPPPPPPGVHPTAVLGAGVELGEGVSIGPQAVIGAGAVIGDGTVLDALTFVGAATALGAGCCLHPGVVVREACRLGDRVVVHAGSVIGADGFGFAWDGASHRKIPQNGSVVIEDDVEIGAGCAIDRGTVGETRIGRGSKLDNLVHVGHNVQIGERSLLIAQVGIGGSTRIGRRVTLAGQVGIVGHVEIGDDVQIGAQAGVIGSVPAGSRIWGYPAMPLGQSKRVYAAIKRTPELLRAWKALAARVEQLERRLGPALEEPAARRQVNDGQATDD